MRAMSGGIINFREDLLSDIHVEMDVEQARVIVTRISLKDLVASLAQAQPVYRFFLSLTPLPENIRGRYPRHWGEQRFQRLGNFFVVPPQECLELHYGIDIGAEVNSDTITCICCEMQSALINEWFPGALEWTPWRLERSLNLSAISMQALTKMMARELIHQQFSSAVMVGMLVKQVAIEVGRFLSAEDNEPVKGGLATWRLRMIDERIQEFDKPPTLDEMAELCNISVRQLSRGFRVSRGCSLGSYIEYIRFEQAKRMILNGENIKTVSEQMGYGSQSSFTKAFRRATGLTPSQFQTRA